MKRAILMVMMLAPVLAAAEWLELPLNGTLQSISETAGTLPLAPDPNFHSPQCESLIASRVFDWRVGKCGNNYMKQVGTRSEFNVNGQYGYGAHRTIEIDVSNWSSSRSYLVTSYQTLRLTNFAQGDGYNRAVLFVYCLKNNGEREETFASQSWAPTGGSSSQEITLSFNKEFPPGVCRDRMQIRTEVFAKRIKYAPLKAAVLEIGSPF